MKCKSCGEVLEEGDAFCSECGSECLLKQTCGHCGAQVSDKQDFCKQCGFRPDLKCPCEATLKPQQKFCRKCGLKAFHPVEKRVCPDCKTHLESDARFCEECRFKVKESTSLPTSTLCCEKLQSKQPEAGESSPQTKCADPKQPSLNLSHKKVRDADEGTPSRGVVGETIDTPECHDSEVSSENTEDEESIESSDSENSYDTAEEVEIEPDYDAVEVDKLVKSSPETGCAKQQPCMPDRTLFDEAHSAQFQEIGVTPTTTLDLPAEVARALPEQAELTSSSENTPAELAISKTASVSSLEHPVPDTTPSQSSSLDEFGTDIEDQEEAAKKAERSRTAYPDNIASVADTASAADGTDDTQPDDAKTSDPDSGKEEGQMEEKEEELSRHSSESGCQSIPAEQSRGTGSHRNKPGGKQKKKKVSQKRGHQQHSAFALGTADETKASPEKSEFGSTVFETTRSKKTDLDINELASAEQPADSAPETSPDTTPAQSSSPCESGTHVKDTEPAAKGTETEGKGDSVDIGGTETAPPAEGNDDSKPAVARSESGSGEEKEEETEESEGELSGDSSGDHHTPAEQLAGKGSHMKKPSDNRRKNKEGLKKREEQQHSASTKGTADETEASPEQSELSSPTTVCEATRSEKTDIDMKESTSAEQPGNHVPETSSDTRPAESSSPCGSAACIKDSELGAEGTETEATGDSADVGETETVPPSGGTDNTQPDDARSESGSSSEKEWNTGEKEGELAEHSTGCHSTPAELTTGKGGHRKKPNATQSLKRKQQADQQKGDYQQHSAREKCKKASVVFHVVISNHFASVRANNHRVFVCLGSELGQQQSHNMHQLHQTGKSGDCGNLYRGQVMVGDLPKNQKFQYSYCVEKDGRLEWEKVYFHKGVKTKDKVCRELELQPSQVAQKGTWDVYDWVAYPDGMKGMVDSFRKITRLGISSREIFATDIASAFALFLPSLEVIANSLCLHVGNAEQHAEDFLTEIREITQNMHFCPESKDIKRIYSKCVEECLLTPLLEHMMQKTSENTVVLAMFLLLLAQDWDHTLSLQDKTAIFRGLLIKPDVQRETCPDIEHLFSHFPLLMKDQHAAAWKIQSFLSTTDQANDPSWLYCIPLLHLLCDESKPFKQPTPSGDHRSAKWWGVHKLDFKVEAFKAATAKAGGWSVTEKDIFKDLVDAFKADPLMMRSFAAAMSLNQFTSLINDHNFPAEIIMAAMFYHIHTIPDIEQSTDEIIGDILRKTASTIKSNHDWTRDPASQELKLLICVGVIGVDLLKEVTAPWRKHMLTTIPSAFVLQLSIMSMLLREDQHSKRANTKQTGMIVDKTFKFVWNWLQNFEHKKYSWPSFIQIMEECIQSMEESSDTDCGKQLRDVFFENVRLYIAKMPQPIARLAACMKVMEGQGSLSNAVAGDIFKHMECALEDGQFDNFCTSRQVLTQTDMLQLHMSKLFTQRWREKSSSAVGKLEFCFTWKPLIIYISILDARDPSWKICLTPEVADKVKKTVQYISDLNKSLADGSINVFSVRWLMDHQKQFLDITHSVLKDRTRAHYTLRLRAIELEVYERKVHEVNRILEWCKSIIKTDDASDEFQRLLDDSSDMQNKLMSSICVNPPTPDDIGTDQYKPRVQIKTVPERFQSFLPCLAQRYSSALFCHMLETFSKLQKISSEDKWWDVLVSVWRQTEVEWQQTCEAMRSGQITFPEAEKLFSIFENSSDRIEKCKRELQKMIGNDGDGHLVNLRIQQFQCLSGINSKKNAAKVLSQIKEDFGFCGDLEDIQAFQDFDMTQPIRCVDLSMVDTSAALQDIDSIDVELFRQFGSEECTKFVLWVRETMAIEGLKEVKVFVDLALNHVGDNPHDMDKVRNLRAVITGYAPLIFQMTTETTFLERCREVACNIKADPDLPAKLESTVTLLEWFDKIHKFHGSVEKTALAQVESITNRGILKIGRLKRNWKRGIDLEFSDVICLELPKDPEGQSDARTYSYQDLVDLQSRLMLVVGHDDQGKTDVDRFISVMDSVERLVKTYIQLCRDGCLLFLNWTVKLYFDQTRGVCCIVEFFRGEGTKKQLKGKQDPHTLEAYMAKVAHYLDSSRDNWLNYVGMKRKEYEELNMYTMDQLVFLQEQLILLENEDVSPQVFPLLSLLQPQCTIQDVRNAVEQAAQQDVTPDGAGEDEEEKEEKEKIRLTALFIQHMQENSFSKQLAIKALKNDIDPSNLDEGVTWCFEHFEDEGDDEDESINEEDIGFTSGTALRLQTREGTIASALEMLEKLWSGNQLPLDTLAESLTETWNQFLLSVKDSGDDFLSLHHLGIVLKFLKKQDNSEHKRQLPPPLKEGEPNLIVCPKGEVLHSVTSIYMHTKEAPLPQPDEVLLCTLETTLEEVRNFLQRAFSVSSFETGKIHCLAFADSLDYDVSEGVEKDMKKLIKISDHPYHLVVICTSENEFSSRITAALERYLRPPCTLINNAKLLEYLSAKFTIPDDADPQHFAASVDPERMCVRVVKSSQSGMGKTLYKNRVVAKLKSLLHGNTGPGDDSCVDMEDKEPDAGDAGGSDDESVSDGSVENKKHAVHVTVPLYEKWVNTHHVAMTLLHRLPPSTDVSPRLIHLDIAYEVQEGVDLLLYNLLVLGCITDVHGQVWRRSSSDLYLVEAMPLLEHTESEEKTLLHQIFAILPSVKCWSPCESLSFLGRKEKQTEKEIIDQMFDSEECNSTVFQRPIHYLSVLPRGRIPPFDPKHLATRNKHECLEILIRHCGVKNPSWSELYHFVSFLNKQLEDFEHSIFCSSELSRDLPGFPAFVLKFLIHMSRDFATRSINMAEESLPVLSQKDEQGTGDTTGIQHFQMRRTWESSPHPYIFFNPDQTSMTFLGFKVHPRTFDLITETGDVLEREIMRRCLYQSLLENGVPLFEDFDKLPRDERLLRLYQVMGVPDDEMKTETGQVIDPDSTYELTTDNVKKIMAIYMRFRCNIPVIIMGETGCGKTRLVKFLCALQTPKLDVATTMIIMKVHGGTKADDIQRKVQDAEMLAKATKKNMQQGGTGGRPIYTVLFFDEANTTEAIGAIKEVMCDGAMNGRPIKLHQNLKMVAACNPYRKHSQKVIQRLEKAGLGYHISAQKTCDKLGRIPMRQLVYRVQPLPQSMLPLVWDFGQLDIDTERLYIRQMVLRYRREEKLGNITKDQTETLCNILVTSQKFLRDLKDECHFVSLRDADRVLTVISWFLQQPELQHLIGRNLNTDTDKADITVAVVLALGVCYRAGIRSKEEFERNIVSAFSPQFDLSGPQEFRDILNSCQDELLKNVKVGEKIARNQALKENVFMMVVCVELRIPLFVVGKPGSSKSLAKAIVADAMQGAQSINPVFKTFKEAQMVSFQCSPLATADGILGTFRQCAHIQHDKDKDKFVAVAVLDEIGLAEDSPKMPLKALHPLLEDGCELEQDEEVKDAEDEEEITDAEGDQSIADSGDDFKTEEDAPKKSRQTRLEKVAFIGISNWALDPAKMNRGILVQRDVPDEEELVQTAEGICGSGDPNVLGHVKSLVKKLARAYLSVFQEAVERREFFGLRDFYSLVKMVHGIATSKQRKLTGNEFRIAICRNFGGLDNLDPLKVFSQMLTLDDLYEGPTEYIDSSYSSLLHMALTEDVGESRYLLLLTENYSGLHILTDSLLAQQPVVPIFGSSFPKDQEYTQICCNINRIKVCMETGKTVILLNLDNLYESLYDALNQYYSKLAGARYVDLGLGTHRVKCKVDTKFRLIVVAEKQTVYDKFPIPLINRLEKHFLTVNNLLNKDQLKLAEELTAWVKKTANTGVGNVKLADGEVFIGYHSDIAASTILMSWDSLLTERQDLTAELKEEIMCRSKATLLWCATPDTVLRLQDEWCTDVYFRQQQHDSLTQYLQARLQTSDNRHCLMAQVTTHSKLLTDRERSELERQHPGFSFTLLSLHAFHTEQQFRHKLNCFLRSNEHDDKQQHVLLVQCERGNINQNLLQCAEYCVQTLWSDVTNHHIVFIVQLPRVATKIFSGFMGGLWHCAHVDDLRSPAIAVPSLSQLQTSTPAQLLASVAPDNDRQPQTVEELERTQQSFTVDLVRHLMTSCIQAAVARVRDGAFVNGRSAERIAILLGCLEQGRDDRFVFGILKMVVSMLQEKETRESDAKNWLAQDAATPEMVKKAGTMRRAWMLCLEHHMVPILAGVIAYLDTNHNLDMLNEGGWALELWLRVLHDPSLCRLQYSDLLSMSGHQTELREFACRCTFAGEDMRGSSLPFSWVIVEMIEAFLVKPPAQEDNEECTEEAACEAFEKSTISCHLQDVISPDLAPAFLHRYLSDLLHVTFRLNVQQHELLMQCMNGALGQEGVEVQAHRLSQVLVRVHRLMVTVRPRLQAVLDMAACHPQAIQTLQDKRRDPQVFDQDIELIEDILLLEILAKELTPQPNQMNTEDGCLAWLDLYSKVAPLISRVMQDADCNSTAAASGQRRETVDTAQQNWLTYGPWCQKHLIEIRCLWTRVSTVKLFIDYMSPLLRDTSRVQVDPKRVNYNLLWTRLGKDANLKTKKTLELLDQYLKHANTQMVKNLLGDVGVCKHCNTKLEGTPVQLPCKHRICDKCYTQEARVNSQCPDCRKQIPQDFDPEQSCSFDKAAVDHLECYQRQTSAFLMAVVSQLCFAGQEPPEPDAVEHIFSYVIQHVEGVTTVRTQQLTLRDDQMDPSPVLRSFILRLLLKHSESQVSDHISQFLSVIKEAIQQQVPADQKHSVPVLTELSLLIIHCSENLECEKEASFKDESVAFSLESECTRIKQLLSTVRLVLESSPLELHTLTALGKLRFALAAFARILHANFIEPENATPLTKPLKDLAMEVSLICTMGSETDWPKKFFVKMLCRDFGVQSYMTLLQRAEAERCLNWIRLNSVDQVEEVADRYLMCGPQYPIVRDEIKHEIREHGELLMRLSEMKCSSEMREYIVLLALHREITMAFMKASPATQKEVKETAQALVQSRKMPLQNKEFAACVVDNTLGVPDSPLCVGPHHSLDDQSLACVLTHFWMALRAGRHERDILSPFTFLLSQPAEMMDSFLPTMPQDNVEEIMHAMRIGQEAGPDLYAAFGFAPYDNTMLWECPRGHRYTIGECGRPRAVATCPECGVQIGAVDTHQMHVPAEGNRRVDQITDRTQPGHTLGAVEDRSREAVPERGMSAAACTLVRFLTHAVLFISASQPGQVAVVSQMIRPAVREEDVIRFFWGHLHKDLQVLQHVLGRCCDDIYLLLHHLCHQLAELPPAQWEHRQLESKTKREQWERRFTETYVQPVIQHMDRTISEGNDTLVSDARQGQNQLLNTVFEVEEQDSDESIQLQHTAAPWKYRTHITVDHFYRQFQLSTQSSQGSTALDLPVLKLFFDEGHHLQALHYVSDIMALQHRILQQLRHRLNRLDAKDITIQKLMNKIDCPDLPRLLEIFSKAWDIIKEFLVSYRCRTVEGIMIQLPEEYHTVSVSENSPVGMLLPDTEGPGRCAYLLIHYLLVQHNNFLAMYCPHTRQKYAQLPEVRLHEITRRHLVSYSPQADLLPLVLAHCNYSLHLGHGDSATATRLEYDFQGFELQLKNTLLLSKSRVHRNENGSMEIETMTYCADTTNSRLINKLRNKIDQIPITLRVQRQIAFEFGESLPDICQSIDSINTTLPYLITLKVTPDQPLHTFMTETLRMRDTEGLHSRKAQQHCRVGHVQSLWLMLCFLRARLLAIHKQEAFDGQGEKVREELSAEQKEELEAAFRRLSPERVELVLAQIFQCIVLRLIPQSKDEDYANPGNYSLPFLVHESLENPLYSNSPEDSPQDQLTEDELQNFPESILASQAIPAWLHLVTHYVGKSAPA